MAQEGSVTTRGLCLSFPVIYDLVKMSFKIILDMIVPAYFSLRVLNTYLWKTPNEEIFMSTLPYNDLQTLDKLGRVNW